MRAEVFWSSTGSDKQIFYGSFACFIFFWKSWLNVRVLSVESNPLISDCGAENMCGKWILLLSSSWVPLRDARKFYGWLNDWILEQATWILILSLQATHFIFKNELKKLSDRPKPFDYSFHVKLANRNAP